MAKPVADSSTSSGRRTRKAGQSRLRCGRANGSRMKNAPIQRTQDSVIGGTWPATCRATRPAPAMLQCRDLVERKPKEPDMAVELLTIRDLKELEQPGPVVMVN